jgi:hypothetical protein
LGSYIALLAVAFQLVVSFGHVHLDGLGANSPATIEASNNIAPAPAHHDGPEHADHYCAICALIHLAGAVAPPEPPPSIPLPVVFGRWRPNAVVKFGWTPPSLAFFAARAPPIA